MLGSEDLPDPIHELDLRQAGVERDPTERVVKRSELQIWLCCSLKVCLILSALDLSFLV